MDSRLAVNFRDVGITFRYFYNDNDGDTNAPSPRGTVSCQRFLLPSGILLRSAAFDDSPIPWTHLGRPRLILNLREYHAEEAYRRIGAEADAVSESCKPSLQVAESGRASGRAELLANFGGRGMGRLPRKCKLRGPGRITVG